MLRNQQCSASMNSHFPSTSAIDYWTASPAPQAMLDAIEQIATDIALSAICVCVCVCVCVCWSRPGALQKQLSRLSWFAWALQRLTIMYWTVYIWEPPGEYDWTIRARRRCGLSLYQLADLFKKVIKYTVKNIRISMDILWRLFHILTEPVPYTFLSANRQKSVGIRIFLEYIRHEVYRYSMKIRYCRTKYTVLSI